MKAILMHQDDRRNIGNALLLPAAHPKQALYRKQPKNCMAKPEADILSNYIALFERHKREIWSPGSDSQTQPEQNPLPI